MKVGAEDHPVVRIIPEPSHFSFAVAYFLPMRARVPVFWGSAGEGGGVTGGLTQRPHDKQGESVSFQCASGVVQSFCVT